MGIAILFTCCFLTQPAHSTPVSNHQTSAGELFKVGVENMRRGHYQEAIQDFTHTIQQRSDFAAAYSNRCLAYVQIQRLS